MVMELPIKLRFIGIELSSRALHGNFPENIVVKSRRKLINGLLGATLTKRRVMEVKNMVATLSIWLQGCRPGPRARAGALSWSEP